MRSCRAASSLGSQRCGRKTPMTGVQQQINRKEQAGKGKREGHLLHDIAVGTHWALPWDG